MNLRKHQSVKKRREALEKELAINLSAIGSSFLDETTASERNCENMIGFAQIPLGVAGPLHIIGEKATGQYYLPLATTEGALVASINRGSKAITESGGASVFSYKVGVTRGVVFDTGSLEYNKKVYQWVKTHKDELKKTAEQTSSHLTFKDVMVKGVVNYLYLRFSFDTKDAMGMNMATIASESLVSLIEKETGVTCLSVAGNFDVDKKPSWINMIHNRGIKAWAEVFLPKAVVSQTLKTTPHKFFDVWLAKCMVGSAISGSMGFNAQFANVIAALFLATGQDAAHVVEGSIGITTAKVLENGDLYVSVYLPSLMVGTVGGGTQLPTQSESFNILGIPKEGNVLGFAEIAAGAVLAGEISLLASLSARSLAASHIHLARGKGNI